MPGRFRPTGPIPPRYDLVRSRRRSVSLIVRSDGSLEIRCPMKFPRCQADQFIQSHAAWISRKQQENQLITNIGPLPAERRSPAAEQLQARIRQHLAGYPISQPARLVVRDQRSRWGSCSSRGHIAINSRCDRLPIPLQDYVILHELCHLAQMNHGPAFWQLLEAILPDARARRKALARYRLVQEENP